MNPIPHIHHALRPFRPYLTTHTFTQPGPGLLLLLALGALLGGLWVLGGV